MRLTTVKLAKPAQKRGEGRGGEAKDERPNTKEIKAKEKKNYILHTSDDGRWRKEDGGRRTDKTAARAKDATRCFYSNCKHVEVELSERELPEKLPQPHFTFNTIDSLYPDKA